MIDRHAFRRALSQFATGVAVVTARGDAGAAVGMTMSSFNSVSLDPPLVLFSVERKAYSLPSMLAANGYAVNILSRQQEALSNQFAKSLGDKWSDVEHSLGHAQSPLIHGVLAHFECEPYANHDGGDHVIFIGRVIRFTAREDGEPLVFFRGKYHNVSLHDQRQPAWPLPIHY
ncbi:flavin reductase family protein [Bradyrhizobium sp. dw_78]|uniref:flavin reductase family protein n=1 Tax=Bradyrhizobium sp. dw_78 TaxID=2719793 RepID=UPI001C4A32B3|nr:flavin reductase family protein [Bradyrhizobium sp. dw_78]